MSSELTSDTRTLDIEKQFQSLEKELVDVKDNQTNALGVLGIESNERRLTRFLNWLLTSDESHGGEAIFLNEFLKFSSLKDIEVQSIKSFFVVNGNGDSNKTEIDLVLIGRKCCIGVEIKTTHQEEKENLDAEWEALQASFPHMDDRELLYLTYAPKNSPVPDFEYPTILWSDLLNRFETHVATVPGEYEQQLINDFIETVRTHVMTDFDGLSDQTELYIEYADSIEAARSAREDDREAILNALASEFYSSEGIDDTWKDSKHNDNKYMRLYKPLWQSLNNNVNMEFEPHPKLKTGGSGRDALDIPHIRVRFDVEHGTKTQPVREAILDYLGEEGKQELESSGFSLFSARESGTKFISKPVPLVHESDDYNPISASNKVIQDLREIIEIPADEVADEF